MTFGVKTNERPGTRAQVRYVRSSAYKAREVLDLIRGEHVDRRPRDPRVLRARHRPGHPQGASSRPSPTPRHNDGIAADELVRVGLLRRRGPHPQALAPPGPWPGHPHPQAHLPHHRHRGPHRRPIELAHRCAERSRSADQHRRPGRRGPPPACAPQPPGQGRAPRRGRRARSRARPRPRRRRPTDEAVTTTTVETDDAVEVDRRGRATDEADTDGRRGRRPPRRRRGRAPTTRPPRPTMRPTPPTAMPTERTADGSEGQPVRVPPRRHHRLEVALVRRSTPSTATTSSRTGRSATTS